MKSPQAWSRQSINVLKSQTSKLQFMNIEQHDIHTEENESRAKILHTSFPPGSSSLKRLCEICSPISVWSMSENPHVRMLWGNIHHSLRPTKFLLSVTTLFRIE